MDSKHTDWAMLRREYIMGDESIKALSARFGVSESNLTKRCAREKWAVEREKSRRAAAASVSRAYAAGEKRRAEMLLHAGEDALNKAIETLDMMDKIQPQYRAKALADIGRALRDVSSALNIRSESDREEQGLRLEKMRQDIAAKNPENNAVEVVIRGASDDDAARWGR